MEEGLAQVNQRLNILEDGLKKNKKFVGIVAFIVAAGFLTMTFVLYGML